MIQKDAPSTIKVSIVARMCGKFPEMNTAIARVNEFEQSQIATYRKQEEGIEKLNSFFFRI